MMKIHFEIIYLGGILQMIHMERILVARLGKTIHMMSSII